MTSSTTLTIRTPLSTTVTPPAASGTLGPTLEAELRATLSPRLPSTTTDRLVVPTLHGPRTYANLDHAASTPALSVVAEAVDRALGTYASVHRGNGFASRVTSAWYEQAREEVARFVGARPDDQVVFTRTTTDSWNLLSRALPEDTTVVVFASEHHSTLLPWGAHRTVTLPVPRSIEAGLAALDQALAQLAPASTHLLVVIAGASNVTGEVWPVQHLVSVAHRHGARLALDAAQLVAHRAVDLAGSDVDYVAFSGHKLYAPYGAGVLAGRADWLDSAEPYLVGGGATARVTEQGVVWATGPARHEGGSPNVLGAIAIAAACATLAEYRDDLALWEHHLAERLRRGLGGIAGVRLHSLFGEDSDRVGVVAFTIDGLDSSLVSTALSVEHGIGVRDGKFCAHPLVDCLLETAATGDTGGNAGTPTTAVRASLGLAVRPEHVERLITAVAGLASSGPELAYTHSSAGWVPEVDPREIALDRPW